MRTKENLMGFYNLIPPFVQNQQKVLCIIYAKGNGVDLIDLDNPNTKIYVGYYSDQEEVKISSK